MLIGDLVDKNAAKFPNKVGLVYQDRRYTYREMRDIANQYANAFIVLGVKPGDRVAYMLLNSDQFAFLLFGLAKAGALQVPINAHLKADEVSYLLENCQASFIVGDSDSLPEAWRAANQVPQACSVLSLGPTELAGARDLLPLVAQAATTPPNIPIDDRDAFLILYTSGTTGKPKGAMLGHRNSLTSSVNRVIVLQLLEDDSSLCCTPLYHSAGLFTGFLTMMVVGGKAVIMRRWDVPEAFRLINKEGITYSLLVPTMLRAFLEAHIASPVPLPTLSKILYGADRCPVALLRQCLEHFSSIAFYNGYGLTEAGPSVSTLMPKYQATKMGSAGWALPLVHFRVVNEHGNDVQPREVGEIIVKDDSVMIGYYNNPEATRAVLHDGWLYTGDLGTFDEDGFLWVVDRRKDMIISGGVNIYPREIEEVLFRHPAIEDVAVIGVPDEQWGESVKAFVVKGDGSSLTAEEVIEYCRDHLASFKKPRLVEFIPELPKTANGKVIKEKLRQRGTP
ncbi:MAG: long-chain-fatty-acid--CoA ligase [Chloroflexi bacterium]|nr:long-chain-fatty-acid--CoA ligase [Chloroflexota bacterium]